MSMSRLKLFLLDLKGVGLQDSPANQQAKNMLLCSFPSEILLVIVLNIKTKKLGG